MLALQTPASLRSALRIWSGGKVGLLEAENQLEYRFWYRQKADVLNSLQIPVTSCRLDNHLVHTEPTETLFKHTGNKYYLTVLVFFF